MTQAVVLKKLAQYLAYYYKEEHLKKLDDELNDKTKIPTENRAAQIKREREEFIETIDKLINRFLQRGHCFGFSLLHAVMDLDGCLPLWEHMLAEIANWDETKPHLLNEEVNLTGSREVKGEPQSKKLKHIFDRVVYYLSPSQAQANEALYFPMMDQLNILDPDSNTIIIPQKGYGLALMSNSELPPSNTIELDIQPTGYAYRVIGLDAKKVETGIIPWVNLPPDALCNKEKKENILAEKSSLLPAILQFTSKEGHTQSKEELASKPQSEFKRSYFEMLDFDTNEIKEIKTRKKIAGNLPNEQLMKDLEGLPENSIILVHNNKHTIRLFRKGTDWIVYDPEEYDHTKLPIYKTFSRLSAAINEVRRIQGVAIAIEAASFQKINIDFPECNKFLKISAIESIKNDGLWLVAKYQPKVLADMFKQINNSSEGQALLKTIIEALPQKNSGDWRTLHVLARHAPEALLELFNQIKNSSQKDVFLEKIIEILPHKNQDNWTVLHFITEQAPSALLQLVNEINNSSGGKKLLTKIIEWLLEKHSNGESGLDFLLRYCPDAFKQILYPLSRYFPEKLPEIFNLINRFSEPQKMKYFTLMREGITQKNNEGGIALYFLIKTIKKEELSQLLNIIVIDEDDSKKIAYKQIVDSLIQYGEDADTQITAIETCKDINTAMVYLFHFLEQKPEPAKLAHVISIVIKRCESANDLRLVDTLAANIIPGNEETYNDLLVWAAQNQKKEIAITLLKANISLTSRSGHRYIAFQRIVENGWDDVLDMMLATPEGIRNLARSIAEIIMDRGVSECGQFIEQMKADKSLYNDFIKETYKIFLNNQFDSRSHKILDLGVPTDALIKMIETDKNVENVFLHLDKFLAQKNHPAVLSQVITLVIRQCEKTYNFRLAELLTEKIIPGNESAYGTLLVVATEAGHKKTVENIIKLFPNPYLESFKKTALYVSVKNNHLEIISLLLNDGVNPNMRNKAGKTPLALAEEKDHLVIAKVLKETDRIKRTLLLNEVKEQGKEVFEGRLMMQNEASIKRITLLALAGKASELDKVITHCRNKNDYGKWMLISAIGMMLHPNDFERYLRNISELKVDNLSLMRHFVTESDKKQLRAFQNFLKTHMNDLREAKRQKQYQDLDSLTLILLVMKRTLIHVSDKEIQVKTIIESSIRSLMKEELGMSPEEIQLEMSIKKAVVDNCLGLEQKLGAVQNEPNLLRAAIKGDVGAIREMADHYNKDTQNAKYGTLIKNLSRPRHGRLMLFCALASPYLIESDQATYKFYLGTLQPEKMYLSSGKNEILSQMKEFYLYSWDISKKLKLHYRINNPVTLMLLVLEYAKQQNKFPKINEIGARLKESFLAAMVQEGGFTQAESIELINTKEREVARLGILKSFEAVAAPVLASVASL